MATFKNLKDLEKYLKQQIDKSLKDDMAEYVKHEITASVSDVVYGAGVPREYKRRAEDRQGYMSIPDGTGSLADPEVMDATVKDGVLEVVDNAGFNPRFDNPDDDIDTSKSLAENIEYGYGTLKPWYRKPRPFMETARDNVEQNMVEVMRLSLQQKLGKGNVK